MKTILLSLIFIFSAVNTFSAVKTWDGGGANGRQFGFSVNGGAVFHLQ